MTFGRNRVGYNVARSLSWKGVRVITSDDFPYSMTRFSRYSSGFFVYPSPFRREKEFIDALVGGLRRYDCDVLLPGHREIFPVARNLDRLSRFAEVPISDYETLMWLHDKFSLFKLARKLGIPSPETWTADSLEGFRRLGGEVEFPVIVKLRRGFGAHGKGVVRSREELVSHCAGLIRKFKLDVDQYPIVQEVVDGVSGAVGMVFNRGAFRAGFPFLKLRDFPVDGGSTTFRVGVRLPRAMEYFERLLRHVGFHGVVDGEFLIDEEGVPYIIDVNTRFWGAMYLGIVSGVDFPYILYRMAVDGDVPVCRDFFEGRYARWFWGDLRGFLDRIRFYGGRWGSLRDFLRFGGCSYDDFDLSDPLPFFVSPVYNVVNLVREGSLDPPRFEV